MPHFNLENAYRSRLLSTQVANNNDNYQAFLNMVHGEIDRAIEFMEENSNRLQGDNEDKLSFVIISQLKGARINCSSETNSNGHVDITIQGGKFKWLAEAKVQKGIDWTNHGFKQLTQNYSTGRKNACHGGIIVYNKLKDKSSKKCAQEWRNFLENSEIDVECQDYKYGYFDFTIEHPRSGEPYHIRSYFVNLKYTESKNI